MNRNRIPDHDLNQTAAISARDEYRSCMQKYTVVELSLVVNSYAAGFYMGARHVEARKGLLSDPQELSTKQVEDLATQATDQYVKRTFPRLGQDDEALIRGAMRAAFFKGVRYRETYADLP